MQILGNGVDIVENSRIKKLISNKNFLRRIYTSSEIKFSKKNKDNVKFFAKRFAAKEAFVKAIGTGFREGINFNDISVRNKNSGKPEIYLNDKIKKKLKEKFKLKKFKIFLSLSDEKKYSIAYVVINKIK
tara:strand:- start:1754 stop:2143 length:390 start_codon:yes stop_codon:yes gene_type:complete